MGNRESALFVSHALSLTVHSADSSYTLSLSSTTRRYWKELFSLDPFSLLTPEPFVSTYLDVSVTLQIVHWITHSLSAHSSHSTDYLKREGYGREKSK